MFSLSDQQISAWLAQYLWVMIRISAFLLAVPIFGARTLPARARIALAIPITLVVSPLVNNIPDVELLSVQGFLVAIEQAIIGFLLGFIFQLFIQMFVVAGQIIAMNMGLGFASLNDPANGVVVTVLSQYYLTLATLLFLAVNGHLVLLELISKSFMFWSFTSFQLNTGYFKEVVGLGSWMFAGAMVLALPVTTAILLVNIAFGVMSRAAPQMNIFAVGFPITLVFGLFIIWFGLSNFLPQFQQSLTELILFAENLLG